ncbi:alginate lyase family protein [Pseudomonadota bacterium]
MNVFLPANVSNRLPGLLKLFVVLWALMIQSVSANSQYSGSWYNSDRDGEGFHIEMLEDNQVLVIWFTYPGPTDDPSAEQAWILGSGTITDNTITIIGANKFQGPEFGPDYNKDDLVLLPWGDLSIVFSGNNNATVEYDGLDGEGTTDVIRITSMAQRENATRIPVGFSGAWYNPDTNGQGWFVEVLSDESALVYFFTYDANGNQAWNLAVGYLDGNRIVVPNSQTGKGTFFGTQFDTKDVVREPFVDIALEFENCKSGGANYKTKDGEHSGSMPIERITTLAGNECKVLVVQSMGGGSIESASGQLDCVEARTCLVDIQDKDSLADTFTAVPRSGYGFKGWQEGHSTLCAEDLEACSPDLSGVTQDSTLIATYEPEGNLYYPPTNSLAVCSFIEPVDTQIVECEIKDFENYGYGPLTDFRVTSDDIFYDTKLRKKELLILPKEQREEMCNIEYGERDIDFATYTPTPPLDPEQDTKSPAPGIFNPLVFARIAYSLFDNQDAGEMILRSLLTWAEHEVDLNWVLADYGSAGEGHYQLGFLLPVYALAWDAIRDAEFVSFNDRLIIDRYMHKLMEYEAQRQRHEQGFQVGDMYTCGDPCYFGNIEVFNHAWSQDQGLMTYGVMTKNDTLYQLGIARYFAILDGLVREDGSHFMESQRGGQALAYSIISTNFMIRMAELAANQGHDLYNAEVDGISLHTIMEFHISALEDESLIYQYTQYRHPSYCGEDSEVDVGCSNWNNQAASESWPHGHHFEESWANFEIYRKRFPDSPLVDRYLTMYPDGKHDTNAEGPFSQACEFRNLSE